MEFAHRQAHPARYQRTLRRVALFALSGPGLVFVALALGLRQDWVALGMLTLPLGLLAGMVLAAVHGHYRRRLQRRAFLELLARGTRLHRLNRPHYAVLVMGWFQALLGTGLVALAALVVWDQCDGGRVVCTVLLGLLGLCALSRGLGHAGDYQLQYDAWRESVARRAG